MRIRLGLLLALLLPAAPALAATPIPPVPADGELAVAGVADTFGGLRTFLAAHRSPVGAEYHVVVVARSDPQDRAGPEHSASAVGYVDAVFAAWRERLDPAKHVLIVLAVENRGVAIHTGSRWSTLGFEREAITGLIDESPFRSYARAGDYGQAVERLVVAVDMHLDLLVKERARRGQAAQAALGRAREATSSVRARLEELPYEHAVAEARLASADEALQRAARAQAAEQFDVTLQAAAQAERSCAEATQEVEARERVRGAAPGALAAARERLSALERALEGAAAVDAAARTQANDARRLLDDAEQRLAQGDPQSVDALIGQASELTRGAQARQVSALADHRFRTRTAPAAGAGAAALLTALVLGLVRLYRGRRAAAAGAEVERWEECLGPLAGKLLALEDEHPVVFGTAAPLERFQGETARAFREAAAQSDELFVSFAHARDVLDDAKRCVGRAGPLGWRRFDEALAALTTAEVVVGGEDLKPERLLLPSERKAGVRRRAAELLGGLEAAYAAAKARLGALERVVVEVPERLRQVSRQLSALEERLATSGAAGLPLPAHAEARAGLEGEQGRLAATAGTDPVGTEHATGELERAVAALDARVVRADEARGLLDAATTRLGEDEARVTTLRGQGLKLEEPGFEPDALARAGWELNARARAEVAAGDDATALETARQVDAGATELRRLIDASLASREETPPRLFEADRRGAGLLGQLPERRQRLQALRAQHDDDALRPALDNAEEAQAAMAQVVTMLLQARAGLQPDAQRYLAAAELVRRGETVLGAVEALYVEIEHKAAELDRARAAANAALAASDAHAAGLRALLRGGDAFASAASRATLPQAFARLEQERAAQASARPHWPRLAASAQAAQALLAQLLTQATAEHSAWVEVQTVLPAVRARADGQARTLASSAEDRNPANQELAQARSLLADAERLAAVQGAEWPAVLRLLKRADGCVDASCRLARQDREAAASARQAIAHAHGRQGAVDRGYGHGVRADLSASESSLRRAKQHLAQHGYERALTEALQSTREADEAESEAESKARRKAREEAEERERVARRAREQEAESRRRASSLSASSFGSSPRSSSSSAGSSFKASSPSRSSSGGSSFKSSSGGSSFKSSSGGSSW